MLTKIMKKIIISLIVGFSLFFILRKQFGIIIPYYLFLYYLFLSFFCIFLFERKELKKSIFKMGLFQSFIIALVTEMYGVPLGIYLTSVIFSEAPVGMHISYFFFGRKITEQFFNFREWFVSLGREVGISITTFSFSFLAAVGGILLCEGWYEVYNGKGKLVTTGLYSYVRHPQYLGIILIIMGGLLYALSPLILSMSFLLIFSYFRLAKNEEKQLIKKFGKKYIDYMKKVPGFLPIKF
jgi:protein-S-isoprenylcysteine O-methyltransferase Ste14